MLRFPSESIPVEKVLSIRPHKPKGMDHAIDKPSQFEAVKHHVDELVLMLDSTFFALGISYEKTVQMAVR
jgi:hypothetical protein